MELGSSEGVEELRGGQDGIEPPPQEFSFRDRYRQHIPPLVINGMNLVI